MKHKSTTILTLILVLFLLTFMGLGQLDYISASTSIMASGLCVLSLFMLVIKDIVMSNKEEKKTINLLRTNNSNSDFLALTAKLDSDLHQRYKTQDALYNEHNKIIPIQTVVVGYINDKPIACGCFKKIDKNTIEIKRMYVHENHRGKGFSILLLKELERWAKKLGYSHAILETGKGQPEAVGLYTKCNYKIIKNYGPYENLENSICMKKNI